MSEEFHKQQEQKMKERAEKKEEKKKRKLPAEPDPVGKGTFFKIHASILFRLG